MGKKKCELCGGVARMFCESDQASLCWNCDGKVHGANFLVAKHTRCLLCSACQSPTPWKASGLRLGPTISICDSCVARKKSSFNRNLTDNTSQEIDYHGDRLREDDGTESYEESDDDDEEEDAEEEEEEAENQVVPWDAAAAEQQPPVMMSSSSSVCSGDEGFSGEGGLVAKRTMEEESNDSRPLKRLFRDETKPRSTATMNSGLRLYGERKSDGCDYTSSSSSTLVLKTASKKSRDLSR